jgi:hypothetical protein
VEFLAHAFTFCCWGDTGHYPEWDENHPIHIVGHSTGAQVVRVLQQMLAEKVNPRIWCENFQLYNYSSDPLLIPCPIAPVDNHRECYEKKIFKNVTELTCFV